MGQNCGGAEFWVVISCNGPAAMHEWAIGVLYCLVWAWVRRRKQLSERHCVKRTTDELAISPAGSLVECAGNDGGRAPARCSMPCP
jgi:hypothetical protein